MTITFTIGSDKSVTPDSIPQFVQGENYIDTITAVFPAEYQGPEWSKSVIFQTVDPVQTNSGLLNVVPVDLPDSGYKLPNELINGKIFAIWFKAKNAGDEEFVSLIYEDLPRFVTIPASGNPTDIVVVPGLTAAQLQALQQACEDAAAQTAVDRTQTGQDVTSSNNAAGTATGARDAAQTAQAGAAAARDAAEQFDADAKAQAQAATASAEAAAESATSAAGSATAAGNSATAAGNSATAAAGSASAAATSATNAGTSATAAAGSATSASSSAASAGTSAASASTSAAIAQLDLTLSAVAASANTYTLNLSTARNFAIETTDTGAKTINLTNVPTSAGAVIAVAVRLKYTSAAAITHPAGVSWRNGVTPAFVAGNKYILLYESWDGGATWMGSYMGVWA